MTGAALRHHALVYDDDEDFVAALAPFVADGLRDGDAVVAAVTRHNIDLLRRALGADARAVTFIDRDLWYVRPASTIAGWFGLIDEARARGHRSVRVIGEVAFGAGARRDTWLRYESAINAILATTPAWIICPYDTRRLPEPVITGAWLTHPVVAADRPSALYQQPGRLLRSWAEPLPPIAGEPLLAIGLDDPADPRRARCVVQAVARGLGWQRPAIDDLLLVVTEVAINALVHGRPDRRLKVWIEDTAITCEVTDNGDGFPDPLVGYRPPAHPDRHGLGLWLAGQLSDALATDHHNGVTRVRFRFSRPPARS
ncbi:anti-sigma factor RsbA family regulatory protein [Paractinoplanes rhizophilus]|uniref:Anti-sigma factor RsbA family regulatory protein n=1 Tax=Paractinoplanes rhizophilus TaxID=1416877 RepID=A0ABW2HH71_9ACTN